jgi:hypothetical protein
LRLGQKYEEDWPDDIDVANGSSVILNYNENRNGTTPRNAGVAFSGLFRNGNEEGKVIYLSFALETVFSLTSRAEVISEAINYFDLDSTTGTDETELFPTQFTVSQNYPNPFNPSTKFRVSVPARSRLTVKVYDVLGRLVEDIFDSELNPGSYVYEWNASGFASGVYFLRVINSDQANGMVRFSETKRMVLLK